MSIMPYSIALFAFNRPDLLQRTLTALAANELADKASLTIFCDGPRYEQDEAGTQAVCKLAKRVKGFASLEVVERPQNMGCAASVIDGLTEMFRLHERLIVIEDDILTSPYTLRFLSEGLTRYAENDKVFSVSAWSPPHVAHKIAKDYPYDVYAFPRFGCWGWASWRDRFQDIDWAVSDYLQFKASRSQQKAFAEGGEDLPSMLDMQMTGKINSWAVRACYACFKRGGLVIYPFKSYTLNIGIGSGTHTTSQTSKWDTDIHLAVKHPLFPKILKTNRMLNKVNLDCYRKPSIPVRIINKLRQLFSEKLL